MSQINYCEEKETEECHAKYGKKEVREIDLLFQEIFNSFIVE